MKTASGKAKGRRLQKMIRDHLRQVGDRYGLELEDIESRPMGCSGVDCILSPKAKRVFPFSVEAKNQESLNVTKEFHSHYEKYRKDKTLKLLVHSRNRSTPLVTMRWKDFMKLYGLYLKSK